MNYDINSLCVNFIFFIFSVSIEKVYVKRFNFKIFNLHKYFFNPLQYQNNKAQLVIIYVSNFNQLTKLIQKHSSISENE